MRNFNVKVFARKERAFLHNRFVSNFAVLQNRLSSVFNKGLFRNHYDMLLRHVIQVVRDFHYTFGHIAVSLHTVFNLAQFIGKDNFSDV